MTTLTRHEVADTLEWLGANHPDIPEPVVAVLTRLIAEDIGGHQAGGFVADDISEYLTLFNQHWELSHDQGSPDVYLDEAERSCAPMDAWRHIATSRTEHERDDYLARVLRAFDLRQVA